MITKNHKYSVKEKLADKPDKKLTDFSNTLEGQTLEHINSCLDKDRLFEAYLYLWALIEQVLLIQLITFIAKNLKIEIPKSLWKTN